MTDSNGYYTDDDCYKSLPPTSNCAADSGYFYQVTLQKITTTTNTTTTTTTGTLTGIVWTDTNGNGQNDTSESPIPDITMTLVDSNGQTVGQTTTDETGTWVLTDVQTGNYTVLIETPSGYTPTTDDNGRIPVTVTDSQTTVVNTGLKPLSTDTTTTNGTLVGAVWTDTNGNGKNDEQSPIPDFPVTVVDQSGNTVNQTTTDETGKWEVTNMPTGTYTVQVNIPSGYTSTTDTNNGNVPVVVSSNEYTTVDFGLKPTSSPGSVTGVVWEDSDSDQVKDDSEKTMSNVPVSLVDSTGTVVSQTTTNETGYYEFTQVTEGNYTVVVTFPSGYTPTTDDNGEIPVTTTSSQVTVLNVGLKPTTSTGTVVVSICNDSNRDDNCDQNGPIGGIPVSIFPEGSDTPFMTVLTDDNGTATFNVPNGTYVAYFPKNDTSLPPATTTSGPEFDSTGTTGPFVVTPGSFTPLVAMLQPPGAITGTVWADVTPDGVKDANESGIEGVVVTIVDTSSPESPACTTTTNSMGMYNCSNLPLNGTYVVQVTHPDSSGGFSGEGVNSTTGTVGPIELTTAYPETTANVGIVTTTTTTTTTTVEVSVGTINGTVWLDSDNDGVKDSGEGGLKACEVTVKDTNGTVVATTTTDEYGYYTFTIEVGIYKIYIINPDDSVYSFVTNSTSDNQIDAYGGAEVDVTPGSTSTINGGLQVQEGEKPVMCTSNDSTTSGCQIYAGQYGA